MPAERQVAASIDSASPRILEHMVGQRRAVGILRATIGAYFRDRADGRKPSIDNLLFSGPAGTGKTASAKVLASECASELIEVTGESILSGRELRKLLLSLAEDQVLFIDEIHTVRGSAEAILLKALGERTICLNEGPLGRQPKVLPLTRFKCIGATTDPWCLSSPLRQRFVIVNFQYYTDDELTQLLEQRVRALGWDVEDGLLGELVKRGKQTPRICLQLLQACYRQARSENSETVTLDHMYRTMELFDIDAAGLDGVEQGYIRLLAQSDEPLRLNIIASRLGLPTRTVSRITEPALLRQGFIEKRQDGRVLTQKGMEHLRSSEEEPSQ